MNRCYRLVWNRVRQLFVVASEISRGRGKAGRTARAQRLAWLAVLPLSLSPVLGMAAAVSGAIAPTVQTTRSVVSIGATASPHGGQVTAGSGHISQNGLTTTIDQHSQNLSLNWQSFNIGADSTVNFVQPNAKSIAVNRIADPNGSVILGRLNANGQVFLINPNGVLFGHGAQVNVGGLVASTLNISDGELASGTRHFSGNGSGSVVNQGTINAANGGYIALLGPQVTNRGTLTAPGGTVALAGGNAVTLSFDSNRLLSLQVDKSTLNALADNRQLIVADGGQVLMSAGAKDSLLASVVNNSGTIQAQTVENRAGKIVLLGGMAAGTTQVAGTLDASAPGGGNGGFIETSAARVQVADGTHITTLASAGDAGTWLIDPTDFTIAAGSGAPTTSSIGADTLSSNLGSGNVTIATAASGSENGDIHVNSSVSWSANELTLSAHGDININADVNGSGTAKLALEYGQATVAGTGSSYTLRGARVNLAEGDHFSTRQGNGGSTVAYKVITRLGAEGSVTGIDLQGINGNLTGRYVLGGNIDASATSIWNSGAGFDPIGDGTNAFIGDFDGLGHTITGLTIYRPTTDFVGLFGYAKSTSTIRNIGMLGGSITGHFSVGGLAGYNETGSTITHAYATGTVTGALYVGGLVGLNSGTIDHAYATGAVSGSDTYVGGLVGRNMPKGTITEAYATGAVSGPGLLGGLVGASSGQVTRSYWATDTTGQNASSGGGTGLTAAELIAALPTGFDPTVWGNQGNQTTPYLLGNVGPVFVAGDLTGIGTTLYTPVFTLNQLQAIDSGTTNLAGSYALFVDIDASATSTWNSGAGFDPIGDTTNAFIGDFDGLGHTITGLTIYRPTTNYVGLFGRTAGSAIRNIGMLGGSVTGQAIVGGLVGLNSLGGTITHAYVRGTVTGTGSGNVGGLVGANTGTIDHAYATGAVNGASGVGGLVGMNANGGTITQAYATGAVNGTNDVGGLAGVNFSGTITQAYAAGAVNGTTSVGGLAGRNAGGTITEAYATGAVSGTTSPGGLVGYLSSGTVTRSYWATDTTGQAGSAGGTGLTAVELIVALPAGFDPAVWGNQGNQTTPYLLGNVGPVFVIDDVGGGIGTRLYTPVFTLNQLQAIDSSTTSLAGSYALFVDIDANATSIWNSGAGFDPIGDNINAFIGNFDGLGHTITGLTICRPTTDYVGLFGAANSPSTIRNIGMLGGSVTGNSFVGGLAGTNSTGSTITHAYATGTVTGNHYVGGLVGVNGGTITQAYATGAVNGTSGAGGLVGENLDGTITEAYATGAVSGTSSLGGLVGYTISGTVTRSYWDKDATGQNGSAGGTGLTTAQMMNLASFADWGTDISAVGGSDAAWRIYEGQTGPLLRNFMTSLTVTGGNVSTTYNGDTGHDLLPGDYAFDIDPQLGVFGTAHYEAGSKNVGGYGNAGLTFSGLYSGQQGYDITLVAGTLTVNKAQLGLSTSDVSKTYDGTTAASGTLIVSNGTLFGGDTIDGGSFAFTDKNAGTGKHVSVAGVTVSDGNGGGNYDVTYADNTTSSIIAKAITIGAAAADKIYDGTTAATLDLGGASFAGMIAGDDLRVGSANGHFGDKNAATGKTVSIDGITLVGTDAGNYSFNTTAHATATISQLGITVSATGNNKIYDGTTADSVTLASAGVLSGDTVSFTGTGSFADKNVGTAKAVGVSGIAASGADAGNYSYDTAAATTADITAKTITINATGVDKVYDGSTDATISALGSTGLVSGDVVTFGNTSAAFDDKNAGTDKAITINGITATGTDAGNYSFGTTAGTTADITPATLTYRADPAFFRVGQIPGDLSGAVTGLAGGDTLADATDGTLTWGTSATSASPAGEYAVDGSGLSALNYVFEQAPGNAAALQLMQGEQVQNGAPLVVTRTVAGLQQQDGDTATGYASHMDTSHTPYAPTIQIVRGGVRLP